MDVSFFSVSAFRFAVWGVAVYAIVFGLLFAFQSHLMYFPNRSFPVYDVSFPVEGVRVDTSDRLELSGWWIPPSDESAPIVVFFHGNADNIGSRPDKARLYTARGYGVLLPEYRGYGGNPGSPSEVGLYRDARAFLDWLYAQPGVTSERVILYGESLGSGVATQMATEYPSRALVLDVPFDSAVSVAASRFPFIPFMRWILRDDYDNAAKIALVGRPVLVGLAEKDAIVPARFGRRLYDRAVDPKRLHVYEGAGHMGIYERGFAGDVIDFIEAL